MAGGNAESKFLQMISRRLLPYWHTAKKETAAGAAILACATFVDLLQPWPIKWLVDYVFGGRAAPGWLTSIWPVFGTRNVAGGITAVCLSILSLALLYRFGSTAGNLFLIRAGARVVQQLRCHACEHLHRLSLAYHDRTKVGDSLYRVAYDAHAEAVQALTATGGNIAPDSLAEILVAAAP